MFRVKRLYVSYGGSIDTPVSGEKEGKRRGWESWFESIERWNGSVGLREKIRLNVR
jgi:hypothetical protein